MELSDFSTKMKIMGVKIVFISFQFLFRCINEMPLKMFSSAAHVFFSLMNQASSAELQLPRDTNGFSALGSCTVSAPGPHLETELMQKAHQRGGTSEETL